MAHLQIEPYERRLFGKLVVFLFLLFEAAMVLWFIMILNGSYDPAPSVPALNAANPMGVLFGQMAQIEARHNFMVGFVIVWIVGTLILLVLSRATRARVYISEDR